MKKLFKRSVAFLVAIVILCCTNVQAKPNDAMWDHSISRKEYIRKVKNFKPNDNLEISKGYKKFFKSYAKAFFDISVKHNLNPKYIFALGIQESNWGTTAIGTNNLFGLGSYTSNPLGCKFKTPTAAIEYVCYILQEYTLPETAHYRYICSMGFNPETIEGQMALYSADPTKTPTNAKSIKNVIRQVFGRKPSHRRK